MPPSLQATRSASALRIHCRLGRLKLERIQLLAHRIAHASQLCGGRGGCGWGRSVGYRCWLRGAFPAWKRHNPDRPVALVQHARIVPLQQEREPRW